MAAKKARSSKLTPKQARFVEEYLIDLNATQAAIRAGYSVETAKEIGSQNFTKLHVRTAIEKAMAERSKRTGVTQDRIVLELARIAFVNATDVIADDATVMENATRDDTAAIQSVKVKVIPTQNGDGVEREIKLGDKLKALELLGKHIGMWNDKQRAADAREEEMQKASSGMLQLMTSLEQAAERNRDS